MRTHRTFGRTSPDSREKSTRSSRSSTQKSVSELIENFSADTLVGVDEVGYGCLAGPLVACAVVVPTTWRWEGLRDSKKLSPKRREVIFEELAEHLALEAWSLAILDAEDVDALGAGRALRAAHIEAVEGLHVADNVPILVDGEIVDRKGYIAVPGGDDLVPAIAAASVLAKVVRDRWMTETAHRLYPQYRFPDHKGYGTADHLAAIERFGPCPLHRRSYKPLRSC